MRFTALFSFSRSRRFPVKFVALMFALLMASASSARAQDVTVEKCSTGILPAGNMNTDLLIDNVTCLVDGKINSGIYVFRNVNVINHGTLTFADAPIDFHAHGILVELNGTLSAGATSPIKGPLTFWLWGSKSDGVPSITCKSDTKNQCGVPDSIWNSNPNVSMKKMPNMPCTPAVFDGKNVLPNGDCFYPYEVFDAGDPAGAYFGRKVLAVSAGGNIMLRGAKGIRQGSIEASPSDSSSSWGRLTETLNGGVGEHSLYIDRSVPGWGPGDHIVVTTTDYLPSHTEELVIKAVAPEPNGKTRIDIDQSAPAPMNAVQYPHYGIAYDYSSIKADHPTAGPSADPVTKLMAGKIETRAIIALLTRSIVVASEGDTPNVDRTAVHFPATPGNFFGGHTLAREGFGSYQVQGVEFLQLGQGGSIGHYPVHFHMARSVPQPDAATKYLGTYVADCSIVDSMTRFITVHATQGVTLSRNVGYKSIGHGFYLEDATEINNRIYSNVGISVQGALADTITNPRSVPGILDLPPEQLPWAPAMPPHPILHAGDQVEDFPPYTTDVTTPSTFWIMNTWNDFEYNAAVGVGVCGACYWMPPAGISGSSRYESWNGYASMQSNTSLYGAVPFLTFKGNSCSAAMGALISVGQTNQCNGVYYGGGPSTDAKLNTVINTASAPIDSYPVEGLGQRAKPTVCDADNQADCSKVLPCTGEGDNLANCTAMVVDRFTTGFNWAPTNFAAIWLRGWWYLVDNSAIHDVQNGGLTFISGGGYSRSDAAQGFWSVLKNSVLVGNTQPITSDNLPLNPFASNGGPFNPKGLKCPYNGSYCASAADGIIFVGSNFAVNQRLFNIYDGPAAEYNNIYADVHETVVGTVAQCRPGGNNQPGFCNDLGWMNATFPGVLQSPPTGKTSNNCVLPNAAIAWKQPNGFYYPPAFDSANLVFKNVDIRHFVIQPQYVPGTLTENPTAIQDTYCSWQPGMFSDSFTDIDRETELTDVDGTLTGLTSNITLNTPPAEPTISVTKDQYFNAPLLTDECASGQPSTEPTSNGTGATVDTSPYEYLTTAVVAECARPTPGNPTNNCGGDWSPECTTPACYGVPLYRQTITDAEMKLGTKPLISMMGQASAQRSTLTLNHGVYYVDTSLSAAAQRLQRNGKVGFVTQFKPGETYDFFFLFGTPTMKQTYEIYIGPGLTDAEARATITPGRMPIPDNSFPFAPDASGTWASYGGYTASTGVLTVNVSLAGLADLLPANRGAFCQPANYCSWDASAKTCGCKAGSNCTDSSVCSYAVKSLDCPVDGCYGFSILMPSAFVPQATAIPPPATVLYTAADPAYFTKGVVTFEDPGVEEAGSCHYSPVPTQQHLPEIGHSATAQ